MRLIRFADCTPAPWKNGAGSTRELWRQEDADGVLIRLSVAEITGDQPFSGFPGLDRIILQLDGPPMTLQVDGQDHPIAAPFAFPGEARVTCRLSAPGPAHDLNLMLRRTAFRGSMDIRSFAQGAAVSMGGDSAALSAFLALTPCILSGPCDMALAPWDLLLAERPTDLVARTDGQGVLLAARIRDPAPPA